MMFSAKSMSDAIRMRRKKLKEEGVENMVDTAALPQMNPQDVWNLEKQAQMEETIPGSGDGSEAPSGPVMEGEQMDDSQDVAVLKKKMARIKAIFDSL